MKLLLVPGHGLKRINGKWCFSRPLMMHNAGCEHMEIVSDSICLEDWNSFAEHSENLSIDEEFVYREDWGTVAIANYIKKNDFRFPDIVFNYRANLDLCVEYPQEFKFGFLGFKFGNLFYESMLSSNFYGEGAAIMRRVKLINQTHDERDTFLVSLHSNAINGNIAALKHAKGMEIFYYTREKEARLLSNIMKSYGFKVRFISKANFAIVKKTKMPALLIEMFYHTNAEDIIEFVQNIDNFVNGLAEFMEEVRT